MKHLLTFPNFSRNWSSAMPFPLEILRLLWSGKHDSPVVVGLFDDTCDQYYYVYIWNTEEERMAVIKYKHRENVSVVWWKQLNFPYCMLGRSLRKFEKTWISFLIPESRLFPVFLAGSIFSEEWVLSWWSRSPGWQCLFVLFG